MNVLTQADLDFFKENGYVVVPNAVPQENLDAAIAAIQANGTYDRIRVKYFPFDVR